MARQRRFLIFLTALAAFAAVLQAVTGVGQLALYLTPLFLIAALLLSGHYLGEDRIVARWRARSRPPQAAPPRHSAGGHAQSSAPLGLRARLLRRPRAAGAARAGRLTEVGRRALPACRSDIPKEDLCRSQISGRALSRPSWPLPRWRCLPRLPPT